MTDTEKLEIIKAKFIRKIEDFSDWNTFKDFLRNLTFQRIKDFIKNALQAESKERIGFAQEEQQKSDDLIALKSEIDSL